MGNKGQEATATVGKGDESELTRAVMALKRAIGHLSNQALVSDRTELATSLSHPPRWESFSEEDLTW